MVTILNFEQYRHISSPGWRLGWTWEKREVIWWMQGAQAIEQGNCSEFKKNLPHCCKRNPVIVDLLPGTNFNKQAPNCCRGGVLSSRVQDSSRAVSSFQLAVGCAKNTLSTVIPPVNFMISGPGPGYTCSNPINGNVSIFIDPDGRRTTEALKSWNVTCIYSQTLAHKGPTCCVSLSSFYNPDIVPCPLCSCSCQDMPSLAGQCVNGNSSVLEMHTSKSPLEEAKDIVRCTRHMCPVRIHWHVMLSYKHLWRVKITLNNFNHAKNYTDWNLVAQHPNLGSINQVFSFNYQPLDRYGGTVNDSGMFWGIKGYNDILLQGGNVQTDILLNKDQGAFTFSHGWAFPRRIYFNGDDCVMPPPDAYPTLPNGSLPAPLDSALSLVLVGFLSVLVLLLGV
ncbi:hypothetical protein AMTR_s00008p00083860 [Amborella trichopoda]|uniref:COBRA C-terminal domain-containing protein n=2 Tax=Amborella trichopoda TaxID=13333 RepID=W1NJ85_AMBTC|nr:hypothetical protein AMTR_s00008p00083860 [Amborella trichopoda]